MSRQVHEVTPNPRWNRAFNVVRLWYWYRVKRADTMPAVLTTKYHTGPRMGPAWEPAYEGIALPDCASIRFPLDEGVGCPMRTQKMVCCTSCLPLNALIA
jgi:hypothetical protein